MPCFHPALCKCQPVGSCMEDYRFKLWLDKDLGRKPVRYEIKRRTKAIIPDFAT